jgi:hypothetical protein
LKKYSMGIEPVSALSRCTSLSSSVVEPDPKPGGSKIKLPPEEILWIKVTLTTRKFSPKTSGNPRKKKIVKLSTYLLKLSIGKETQRPKKFSCRS